MTIQKFTWLFPLVLMVLFACSNNDQPDKGTYTEVQLEPLSKEDNDEAQRAVLNQTPEENVRASEYSRVDNLEQLLSSYSPENQNFQVDANQEIVLTGNGGTKMYIPANSLEFEDGSQPSGQVTVQLSEYYSMTDLLAERLSTVSNNQLIESGGTVNVVVSADGRPLRMKAGQNFALYFPREKYKAGMELFYGNRDGAGNMNWTVPADSSNGSSELDSNQATLPSELVASPTVRIMNYTERLGNQDLTWELADMDQNVFEYFNDNFSGPSDVLGNLCALNATAILELTIDEFGQVKDIYFVGHSLGELNNYITSFFKEMPAIDLQSMSTHATNTHLKISIGAMVKYDNKRFKKSFEERYADFRKKAFTKVDQDELKYYILLASDFGWINCDRFIRSEEEKVDFIVKVDNESTTQVMLAFTEMNGMLQMNVENGQAIFRNLPLNEPVKIIGLSVSGNRPVMAQKSMTVNGSYATLEQFSPFNLSELGRLMN